MRRLFLVTIAAAALSSCGPVQAPAPEYRPEEAGTIAHALCLLGFTHVPLEELPTGHHVVEATLNGRTGSFVLDTGANVSVLHAPVAEQMGLAQGGSARGGAIGIGGVTNARLVSIDSLQLGSVDIRQSRIVTADLSQIANTLSRMADMPVYGIIGQDVMREHRAVIDVALPILYLMDEDRDPAPVEATRCREAEGEDGSARTSPKGPDGETG